MCSVWEQDSRHHFNSATSSQLYAHQYYQQSQDQRTRPPHQDTASRQLHRHSSDVSSDRLRHYEAASSNYRAKMNSKRTDYPVVSRKQNNKSDLHSTPPDHRYSSTHRDKLFREHGGGSQGSQGSQGSTSYPAVFRHKLTSSSSLDRHSYNASLEMQHPVNGSLQHEPSGGGGKLLLDQQPGYYPGTRLSETPNSSQSDESNLDQRIPAATNSVAPKHYHLSRSLSSQTAPLSSYSKGTRTGWFTDELEGSYSGPTPPTSNNRYSAHEVPSRSRGYIPDHTDGYPHAPHLSIQRVTSPPSYLHPNSPLSPISPVSSFSSEQSDRYSSVKPGKTWYEDEDPEIHSGFYFPKNSQASNIRHSGNYDTMPTYGRQQLDNVMPVHHLHDFQTGPSAEPPDSNVDRKKLAQQHLDYFFSKQEIGEQPGMYNSLDRRESSPAEYGRKKDYLRPNIDSPHERKFSDSEIVTAARGSPKDKKVKRVKSGGGMVIGKLVKKIGSRRVSGKTKEDIISEFRGVRSQSMEFLDLKSHNSDTNLARRADSPAFTPKLTKSKRQNSEPDLESAIGLFRSGSKKNLYGDPVDALFEAIESQEYETCAMILGDIQFDINTVNDDDWTPLDLAVMINDQIASLLMQCGAKDSNKYWKNPKHRYSHMLDLLTKAETEIKQIIEMTVSSKEVQKQLTKWKNKARLLEKMLDNIQRAGPPGSPRDVTLTVSSDRTLTVKFSEPEITNGAMVTRYRIQWSKNEHFTPESGEFILCDNRKECTIPDLDKGERYFVRVYAFNMKGFGPPKSATPSYAIPSSWHDYCDSRPRFEGCTNKMGAISMGMNRFLSDQQQVEIAAAPGTPNSNSKRSLKKGFTKLFNQGPKFCKSLKSGVYLTCLMHSDEGKILVTADDCLPTIEISDSHSSSIGSDFAWLTKLSCTWDNVREMCEAAEAHTTLPAIQFRFQVLQAIAAMQIGTGQTNLGLVHHKAFQDSHGATVFLAVSYIDDYKSLTGSNKWSNFVRLIKRYPQLDEVFGHELTQSQKNDKLSAIEQLVMDIPNIIHHHTNCNNVLPKGLYLGYLKARLSHLASMTVVTSSTLPNVFPHYHIRSNPNISREEWAWLQSLSSPDHEVTLSRVSTGNQTLQKTLQPAIDHFLEILGISSEDIENHQLYTDEVIELNENVTFLLIMPPPDAVCTTPGAKDEFDGQHFSHLPISAFELLQLYTYQRAFVSMFTSVSCRLDVETTICHKRLREMLTTSEREALVKANENFKKYQEQTEIVWKHMRWIDAAIQNARNPTYTSRLTIQQFKERMKAVKKVVSASNSSSSLSTMLSPSSGGGTLSPARKSLPSVTSTIPSARQLIVYPGYETGLTKGTIVSVPANPTTTAHDVIRFSISEFEQAAAAGHRRRFSEREMKEFYLTAVLGHHEDILPLDYTPLQLLNYSNKYKFIVRRSSFNQYTTEV